MWLLNIKVNAKRLVQLAMWIGALMIVGWLIGGITKAELTTWYAEINRSPLTPPNYVFPLAWTILYILIAISGWIIWSQTDVANIKLMKGLFIMQLLLNWSWTPIFFKFHMVGVALVVIAAIGVLVATIIYLAHFRIKWVSWLLMPYLLWIIFAGHLTYFIWVNN